MKEQSMMDIAAQFLNFMKDAFSSAVEATAKVQEQTLKFFDDLTKRGAIAQEEGKKLLEDWLKTSRESMETFQRQAQENLKRWEENIQKGLSVVIPATKQDVEELSKKIEELTKKVETLGRS